MKKIAILLSLAAFILALASCGGPEADAKKLIKKIESYTAVAKKAAEDQKIDDKEIQELNNLSKELDELKKEMSEKYKDDKDAEEKMKKFETDNKEKIEKTYDELFNSMMTLYECEGADKLDL